MEVLLLHAVLWSRPPFFIAFICAADPTRLKIEKRFFEKQGYSFWLQHGNWGFQYFQYIVQMRIQQRPFFRRVVAM